MRSRSGPESLFAYRATAPSSQRHSALRTPRKPQGQGRVALLQSFPLRLKAPKPRETDFEPQSLGEHVKRRRLTLRVSQKEAGADLGVTAWTVHNWESGKTEPPIESVPAVLRFLGYDPFPEARSIADKLLARRRAMGWSIRKAARECGVDPGTWGDWERGKVILYRAHMALVARLLGLVGGEVDKVMAAGLVRSRE